MLKFIRSVYRQFILLYGQYHWNIFAALFRMSGFYRDYLKYLSLPRNSQFKTSFVYHFPYLTDRTEHTPLDPVYFFQDTWAARKVFEIRPERHIDVGSAAKTIGILSQFVPVTMVDIRPLDLQLDGLSFVKGSILDLPFPSATIDSISSLCVVEHIGLGRYGDPLDQFGSEKAISELIRVTKLGGQILFSVPIESENKVCFNGYRSFTREYIISLFSGCTLLEERYIYGKHIVEHHDAASDNGIGLFHFKKI